MTPRPPANQLNAAASAALMAAVRSGGGKLTGRPARPDEVPGPPTVWVKIKPSRRVKVARTRNAGQWTEAAYWGNLRSGLRRLFRFWKPANAALLAARISYPGRRGRKWAFLCADCQKLFVRDDVQIDHRVPVGSLKCLADLPGFVERLTPERPEDFQILCLDCHGAKSARDATIRNGK